MKKDPVIEWIRKVSLSEKIKAEREILIIRCFGFIFCLSFFVFLLYVGLAQVQYYECNKKCDMNSSKDDISYCKQICYDAWK